MNNHVEILLNNAKIFSETEILEIKTEFLGLSLADAKDKEKSVAYLDNPNSTALKLPLIEDLSLETNSSFQTLEAIFSIAGRIQRILSAVNSLSAQGSAGSLANIFTYEMWQKTDPIALNFKTVLYTKTNPFLDVWLPTVMLTSQSILSVINSKGGKKSYKLPGISLGGVRKFQKQQEDQARIGNNDLDAPADNEILNSDDLAKLNKNAEKSKSFEKLCTVRIPGVIKISPCMIVSAKPTFSRQTSRVSGKPFPIWAEIEMQIKSVAPASSGYFVDELLDKKAIPSF
jgi:hypothetical protein